MNATLNEHPAFTKAKSLPDHLQGLFPKSPAECDGWRPTIRRRALNMNVLVAARTRVECAWVAYIGAVPGINHDEELGAVLAHGSKLDEPLARLLFPEFKEVPYAP